MSDHITYDVDTESRGFVSFTKKHEAEAYSELLDKFHELELKYDNLVDSLKAKL